MRKEDIPPANEYERGVLAGRRMPELPKMDLGFGRVALVQTFVTRLLHPRLSFTQLKISSLEMGIQLGLLRESERINLYPIKLTPEQKRALEEFFTKRGIESFGNHKGCHPWTAEPIIAYRPKGNAVAVSELVSELLVSVFRADPDAKFEFVLT
jgi:hypothetical protein